MNMLRKIVLIFLPACTLMSCGHRELDPQAYISWMENPKNGLHASEIVGDFEFDLQYKPLSYVALKSMKKEKVNKEELLKSMQEMGDLQYYTLRINSANGKGEMLRTNLSAADEYFYRVQYFSFQLKKDLYLLDGKDSLPCVFAHFERTYAISPNNNFILAFPVSQEEKKEK
ncbi:MAG TPA: hypothetical protein VLB84_04400, partial [Bacteroidia bacterium]|nr:hypothetical protein [Bacteroidia bacterium]